MAMARFANQYPTTEETRIDPSASPTLEGGTI
jgi:hypothetical protein